MIYKLRITERADERLDKLVSYLLYNIKNQQAAKHLLDNMESLYKRLEENPFQFPECRDSYLKSKKYREAILKDMDYLVIFKVIDSDVFIMGVFHSLENYKNKL